MSKEQTIKVGDLVEVASRSALPAYLPMSAKLDCGTGLVLALVPAGNWTVACAKVKWAPSGIVEETRLEWLIKL